MTASQAGVHLAEQPGRHAEAAFERLCQAGSRRKPDLSRNCLERKTNPASKFNACWASLSNVAGLLDDG